MPWQWAQWGHEGRTQIHVCPNATDASSSAVPFRSVTRRALLGGIAGLAAASLASCTRRPPGGRAVRVVSIAPSMTEAMFAIGAGSLLVGRSRHCDYPSEALALPVVGGFADPSLEVIVSLSPTLVVGARGPSGKALADALAAQGVELLSPETESIAQIEAMLRALGDKLDRREGAARAVAAIEDRRREVAAIVAGKPKTRAVMLFDVSPIVAAGAGSFADELIREAGGENLVREGGAYPTLDIERLIALDPEVILDGAGDSAMGEGGASRVLATRNSPGFRDVGAIKRGAVKQLTVATLLRPGPRVGDGLVMLARALHPEKGA